MNNILNDKLVIELRDYQKEAINAWVKNNYKGFYVMATGTGKTWTAIFSAKKLVEKHSCMIVICAPYKHLIKQWAEDISVTFQKAKIILVSSENQQWHRQLTDAIIKQRYNENLQIIVISTISSFNMERFNNIIQKFIGDKLLIVDEAHRFNSRSDEILKTYRFMLGLSATPFSGLSAAKGRELMNFFGGQVFNLPIERALDLGYLVPYYYYPIYVHSTDEEEELFKYHTKTIISCFKNNVCINPELLVKTLRKRLRIIAMSEEKQNIIENIIKAIPDKDHFVVYCGDGRLFDESNGEEIRHIQYIKKILSKFGYKVSQFTANENMNERMQLVDSFNKGELHSLVAIRCLDEGINIPSINSALILSSNDDYREFVQRRGRILRKYKNKKYATIYDIIVLPSKDMCSWAKIELRRLHEYARLSKNWKEIEKELSEKIHYYKLFKEDIDVYDYENMEDYEIE